MRRRNIRFIDNTRYLIMPWVRVPHLASHILGRMAAMVSEGLGTDLWTPDLLSGNLHRPGTVAGNVLSSSQLDPAGFNNGAWEGFQSHRPNRSLKQ